VGKEYALKKFYVWFDVSVVRRGAKQFTDVLFPGLHWYDFIGTMLKRH
jgi:hypothetical protein